MKNDKCFIGKGSFYQVYSKVWRIEQKKIGQIFLVRNSVYKDNFMLENAFIVLSSMGVGVRFASPLILLRILLPAFQA